MATCWPSAHRTADWCFGAYPAFVLSWRVSIWLGEETLVDEIAALLDPFPRSQAPAWERVSQRHGSHGMFLLLGQPTRAIWQLLVAASPRTLEGDDVQFDSGKITPLAT